jgi:hypothetical protein
MLYVCFLINVSLCAQYIISDHYPIELYLTSGATPTLTSSGAPTPTSSGAPTPTSSGAPTPTSSGAPTLTSGGTPTLTSGGTPARILSAPATLSIYFIQKKNIRKC